MILGVFIEFFGVKIVIGLLKNHCDLILTVGFHLSQNNRYLSIFYRYLPIFTDFSLIFIDILPIFFQKFQHIQIKSRNFTEIWSKYREFLIFQ